MSEISEDLKRQMAERGKALLSDFLERKPGYDGPVLNDDENERLLRESRGETELKVKMFEKKCAR